MLRLILIGGLSSISILLLILVFPSDGFCWGPGIHAMLTLPLSGSQNILPSISKLVSSFPKEFIWGSIMADMMIGKSVSNWKFHPHNWDFIFDLFEKADKDNLKAFMVGYMVHLSHDVIAHNFLIPEMALLNALKGNSLSDNKNMFHLKIEISAENLVQDDIWKKISEIYASKEIRECSEFLEENLKHSLLTPKLSGMIYRKTIKMRLLKELIRSKVPFMNHNNHQDDPHKKLTLNLIKEYVAVAYDTSENFLSRFDKSESVMADPTGIEPLNISFYLTKAVRRIRKKREIKDEIRFFLALREFQPPILGNKTPVLDILNNS